VFVWQARSHLADLTAALTELGQTVPDRAHRFHQLADQLATRIAQARQSWWRWIDDQHLAVLDEDLARLRSVAPDLARLAAGATTLAEGIGQLENAAKGLSSDTAAWLHRRCQQWRAVLDTLGAEANRPSEILLDQTRLEHLEREIASARPVVDPLLEARRILAGLGDDSATEPLAVELAGLEEQLLKEEATPSWLAQIETLVEALAEHRDRVQTPPPQLRTLSEVLSQIWGWSTLLDEMEEEVQGIERRRRSIADGWHVHGESELPDILDEAETLRDRLVARAHELRQSELREIETLAGALAAASIPISREPLETLRVRPIDRHELHQEWMEEARQVHTRYRGLAVHHERDLREQLRAQVQRLRKQLTALRAGPHSAASLGQADLADREVDDLDRLSAAEGEAVLEALSRVDRLREEVEALRSEAAQEMERFDRDRQDLEKRNRTLQAEAARIGVEEPDLDAEIAALRGCSSTAGAVAGGVVEPGFDPMPLEQAWERARQLAAEIEKLERSFAAACREELDRQIEAVRPAAAALEESGRLPKAPRFPEVPDQAPPEVAAGAVLDARCLQQELANEVAATTVEVRARLLAATEELAGIPAERFGSLDREERQRLAAEVAAGAWKEAADPPAGLRKIAQLDRDVAVLVRRVLREEEDFRHRLQALRQRLDRFHEEHLETYCPELAERAAGFLLGIPERPRSWAAVEPQLQLADQLLSRLDAHCRLVAAWEVQEARARLEEAVHRSPRSAPRDARALLKDLDRVGEEDLPPPSLRARLRHAAPPPRATEEDP
jgi:hypothetical protein